MAEQRAALETALGLLRYLAAQDRAVALFLVEMAERADHWVLDDGVLPDVLPSGSINAGPPAP